MLDLTFGRLADWNKHRELQCDLDDHLLHVHQMLQPNTRIQFVVWTIRRILRNLRLSTRWSCWSCALLALLAKNLVHPEREIRVRVLFGTCVCWPENQGCLSRSCYSDSKLLSCIEAHLIEFFQCWIYFLRFMWAKWLQLLENSPVVRHKSEIFAPILLNAVIAGTKNIASSSGCAMISSNRALRKLNSARLFHFVVTKREKHARTTSSCQNIY